jgi:ATP-dependent RNA helicase DeaD
VPAAHRKTVSSAPEVTHPAKPALVPAAEPGRKPGAKPDRRTPANQTKLFMNIGSEAGVTPLDIVNAIAGETGLPGKVVGKVDIRDRHLFVDVNTDHANAIIAKLNRANIKGQHVKVKVA